MHIHILLRQLESDQLEEPNLPANYQMEEYIKARWLDCTHSLREKLKQKKENNNI